MTPPPYPPSAGLSQTAWFAATQSVVQHKAQAAESGEDEGSRLGDRVEGDQALGNRTITVERSQPEQTVHGAV